MFLVGWRYGVPAGWTVRGLLECFDDSQRSGEHVMSRALVLALFDVGEKVKSKGGDRAG